jgi:hypothetical protein
MRSARIHALVLLAPAIVLGLALLRVASATPEPASTGSASASRAPALGALLQRHARFHQRLALGSRHGDGAVATSTRQHIPGAGSGSRPGDPTPVPIPGGFGGGAFHVWVPGPTELGFQGEDYEPSVITHFQGLTAIAYLLGTATGSDGRTYDMFNDMRVMSGN